MTAPGHYVRLRIVRVESAHEAPVLGSHPLSIRRRLRHYPYRGQHNRIHHRPARQPKILIHTRAGPCVGIYCDQPAKVLVVETQHDPRVRSIRRPGDAVDHQPADERKLVGGYGTALDHVLAMAFDDPSMDDDLRRVLDTHEVVLDGEWPDVW